jgi:hypothetical protein
MTDNTPASEELQLPSSAVDLVDYRTADVWLDSYHEQGLTPRTAGRYQRTPRPEITDLLMQHNLLSDDELRREILARSGEHASKVEIVEAASFVTSIDQTAMLTELREIKGLLHRLLSPRHVPKELPSPYQEQEIQAWSYAGVPDAAD